MGRANGRREPQDDSDPTALTIAEARARIDAAVPRIDDRERLPCAAASGRVLAVDVVSPMNVPRFRAAAMDGFAFRHADRERALAVVGRSLAGHPSGDRLARGECVRVTTGARVPDGADTVVQQENVACGADEDTVRITQVPDAGLHVRAIGSDSRRGTTLLAAGTRLGAAALALLAAHGIVEIDVRRKLRVALFSTGDELVEPGGTLGAGQIHDANRALLAALLADPTVEIVDLGICADSPDALAATLERIGGGDGGSLDTTGDKPDGRTGAPIDLVVSSGGVSVGEADHVRAALERRGEIALWKIAVKPGRPLTFGSIDGHRMFFGLPGNPVSAAVTALLFVRPAIERMLGTNDTPLPPRCGRDWGTALAKRPGRVEYQRGRLSLDAEGHPVVTTTGLQDSHVLRSLQGADCLIELSLESSGAARGELVAVHPFAHFARAPL